MRLILISFFVFIHFCFVACSGNGNGYRIKNADRVDILYNTGNEILKYSDTSRKLINTFMKVLNGKTGKKKCSTMGEISFFLKDSLLFEAGFSISGGKEGCQYLMRGEEAWQLTYAAGMFLSEEFNDLQRKQE